MKKNKNLTSLLCNNWKAYICSQIDFQDSGKIFSGKEPKKMEAYASYAKTSVPNYHLN